MNDKFVWRWLGERGADLLRWPVGGVREAPARVARYGQSVVDALDGLRALPLSLVRRAKGQDERPWRRWLRDMAVAFGGWLAGLVTRLFDLAGGPEFVELILRAITRSSPLTPEEIAEAQCVLGMRGVRWNDVRICEAGALQSVFRRNGGRAFAVFHSIAMPPEGYASRPHREIVVHELTHARQYELTGSLYMVEAIWGQGEEGYGYGGPWTLRRNEREGKFYRHYNREQQAQIVQDYYERLCAGEATGEYEACIAELRDGAV